MQPELKFTPRILVFPLFFVGLLWLVKFFEVYFQTKFVTHGVLPRNWEGLQGILFSPFIHSGYEHLISNSVPLLILLTSLIYFYKEVWLRVFLISWLLGGFWLWLGGRENYHIGASGIVYGLAAFLFLSGVLRKHTGLMALSLLIVFLYGSMVWGIFPLFRDMSWEGHLYGTVAGLLAAYMYRTKGSQRKVYDWEQEDDSLVPVMDYSITEDGIEKQNTDLPANETESPLKIVYQKEPEIKYHYKENENRNEPWKN